MSNTKIWAVTIFIIVITALIISVAPIFPPFIFAAFLAFILNPAVKSLESFFKIPKWAAISVVFLLLAAVITLAVILLIPVVIDQTKAIVEKLPEVSEKITEFTGNISDYLKNKNVPDYIIQAIDKLNSSFISVLSGFLTRFLSFLIESVTKILEIVIVGFSLFYFLLDGQRIIVKLIGLFPKKYSSKAKKFVYDGFNILRNYIRTQIIISLISAIVVGIALAVLGVKYYFLLAFLTFILNFIPYFGSVLAWAITAAVPLFTGGGLPLALLTGLVCLVIDQFTGNILTPKLQAKSSGLHPITVLFSVLACNLLFGAVGMFFAVPIAAFIKIIIIDTAEIISEMK